MVKFHLTERPWFYKLLIGAALLKFTLFFYIMHVIPEAFYDLDSYQYLKDSDSILAFILDPAQGFNHSMFALPGYPLILFFWRHLIGFSIYHVIFVQILFNVITAFIVARIARSINPKWEVVSLFIILFDTPLTIYSQLIMTESFFVFALVSFIYCFHRYLDTPTTRRLIGASLALVACGFIRPAAWYLPVVVAAFVVCFRTAGHWKKTLIHAGLILLIFYGLGFCWQVRNYKRYNDPRMSSIGDVTLKLHSFMNDTKEKKDEVAPTMPNFIFYPYAFNRNIMELMTTPGSTKHCNSTFLRGFTKGFGYFFIVLWIPGFAVGLTWGGKDPRYKILIWIFLYFLCATIWATGWTVTSRFRIAMLPSIAVIASAGWFKIQLWWRARKRVN